DWMPNDIRGSGSTEVRKAELEDLAPIHFGRKKNQPSRKELTKFFDESRERLEFDASQFDNAAREVIAGAFASLIRNGGYTCWACAVCKTHAHLVNRVHKVAGHHMWDEFARASRDALRESGLFCKEHPVW